MTRDDRFNPANIAPWISVSGLRGRLLGISAFYAIMEPKHSRQKA
jgi:hypothetical protein